MTDEKSVGAPRRDPNVPPISQRYRVLVAEDNEDSRFLISLMLKSLGVDVDLVVNGQEAVERLRSQDFDLAMLDIQMPVMGGLEACEKLAGLSRKPPLVAITANVMADQVDIYKRCGFTDVVGKPFTLQDLRQLLTRFCPARS